MIRPVVDVPLMCFCQSTVIGCISIYISPTLFWNRCNGLFCWINKTNVGTGSTLQVINYVVAIDPVYFLWSLTYVVHINIIRKSCWAIRESFLYCTLNRNNHKDEKLFVWHVLHNALCHYCSLSLWWRTFPINLSSLMKKQCSSVRSRSTT